MNISPFNEWPLWHFFSLHMQNSGIVNDAFRTTSLTIPISLLSLDVKAGLSSAVDPYSNVTITQEAARNIINIVNNSFFYDFMNDRIIRVDALDRSKVFISNANIVVNEQALSSIPQGSLLITKGIAKTSPTGGISGGELVPLLGTPTYMREAVMSLSNAQAITRGETTSRYDFLSTLPQQERDRLQSLFRRPIYENTAIQLVLTSYRKQASIPLDLEKKVARLSNSLKKVIPDDKAINVATGTSVKLKACYNIEEYQVIPPGSNEYRTVKFAFPNKMRDEDRQMYIQLLTDRFKATKAKAKNLPLNREELLWLDL
jgi:hypothetical protein